MLIEFSVKNFGCIKDQQKFSMIAGSKNNPFAFDTSHKLVEKLLPTAGIFGANASGKSTFTKAMDLLHYMVLMSHKINKGDKIPATPFLLSNDTRNQSTELEITFLENDNLYRYGFSFDEKRIWEEWLFLVPKEGRNNEVFSRIFDEDKEEYSWQINDKLIKGPKASWRQMTKQTSLFLSVVMQYTDETADSVSNQAMNEAYDWFKKRFFVVQQDEAIAQGYTAKLFVDMDKNKKELGKKVLSLLQSLDIDVNGVRAERQEISPEDMDSIPSHMRDVVKDNFYKVQFEHLDNNNKPVLWDITQESGGTQKLFCLAGPIMHVLETGRVFVVDELHNNFHPHLLEKIISLFQDKKTNKKNAQLIFTSHDVTSMNPSILCADQIWLTEKGSDKASHLIPLSSFKPRGDSLFWKHYLSGRYGAIPNIKEVIAVHGE